MKTCTVFLLRHCYPNFKKVDIRSLKSKLESVNECKECQYDNKRKGISVFNRAQG